MKARKVSISDKRAPVSASDVLHVIFHELRTPLSSIQGYASLLLTGELGSLTAQQRAPLERVRDLTSYLTALMTNLNQWVKLADQNAPMGWEPVDLDRLVKTLCHDLKAEAARKGVRLVAQVPSRFAPLWAERAGLTQVLINLITNAVKFTPTKGRVTVSLQETRGTVRLSISDTGVGIARKAIPELFKEFYHEDKPEVGAVGGTGLGLAIVKRITERHHGVVTVTSQVQHGSTFCVALPRRSHQDVMQDFLEDSLKAARQRHEPFTIMLIESQGLTQKDEVSSACYTQLQRLIQQTIRAEDRYYPVEQGRLITVLARTHGSEPRVRDALTRAINSDPDRSVRDGIREVMRDRPQ